MWEPCSYFYLKTYSVEDYFWWTEELRWWTKIHNYERISRQSEQRPVNEFKTFTPEAGEQKWQSTNPSNSSSTWMVNSKISLIDITNASQTLLIQKQQQQKEIIFLSNAFEYETLKSSNQHQLQNVFLNRNASPRVPTFSFFQERNKNHIPCATYACVQLKKINNFT